MSGDRLAARAVPVAAGVIDRMLVTAVIALAEMTAQRSSSAAAERRENLALGWGERMFPGVCIAITLQNNVERRAGCRHRDIACCLVSARCLHRAD